MRGIRKASRLSVLEALRGAASVADAARNLDCSRALIYQRAAEDAEIRAELERIRAAPPSKRAQQRRGAADDPEIAQKMRLLGLKVLAKIAKDGDVHARDRINAARHLVTLCAPVASRGTADLPQVAPPPDEDAAEEEEPLSAEQVAAALRFKA